MGNIVFSHYIKRHHKGQPFHQELFDNIILNAADVPVRKHYKWASKINFAKKVYSTFNKGDRILELSKLIDWKDGKFFSGKRMGQTIRRWFGRKKAKLAPNVTYKDFSSFSPDGHRHYLSSQPKISKFFHQIIE